jgi:hypothetical protein
VRSLGELLDAAVATETDRPSSLTRSGRTDAFVP